MNRTRQVSIPHAWEAIGIVGRGVISVAAMLTAIAVILMSYKAGVAANDAHTVSLIQAYAAPSEKMLQYIMVHEGLWDSYLKEQNDANCKEAMMHGIPCDKPGGH